MAVDVSFGIIPVRLGEKGWETLIILHRGGHHWGFPKGHAEPGESFMETAVREFTEETGLKVVQFLTDIPFKESYEFYSRRSKIHKTVHYYIAKVDGVIQLQPEEIEDSKWVLLQEASNYLTFTQAKELSMKAFLLLDEMP